MNKFKKGDKVVVVANRSNHGQSNGTVLTVRNISGSNVCVKENTLYYFVTDLKKQGTTEKQLLEEKKTLKDQIKLIDEKLEYLKNTGEKEFNENTYKVLKTLAVLDSKSSQIEKAKVIAKLIDGD